MKAELNTMKAELNIKKTVKEDVLNTMKEKLTEMNEARN